MLPENAQAYFSVFVDIGVPDLCHAVGLWGLDVVLRRNPDLKHELASLPVALFRAYDEGEPAKIVHVLKLHLASLGHTGLDLRDFLS